jgi:hypothetical protein
MRATIDGCADKVTSALVRTKVSVDGVRNAVPVSEPCQTWLQANPLSNQNKSVIFCGGDHERDAFVFRIRPGSRGKDTFRPAVGRDGLVRRQSSSASNVQPQNSGRPLVVPAHGRRSDLSRLVGSVAAPHRLPKSCSRPHARGTRRKPESMEHECLP